MAAQISELCVSDLQFSYPSTNGRQGNMVIDKFDMNIKANEISVIIGSSGCGKTTLLNLIAGILKPTKGDIVYKQNNEIRKPKIGYVFQNPSLIPWRTVKENVMLGVEISGKITEQDELDANKMLIAYGLKDFEHELPSTLSGGMQQRVSIIRAVMSGANILLLDEPFSNSDFILRRELQIDLLRIVTEQNLIAVMVTHDLVEALKIADQIIILSTKPTKVREIFKINIDRGQRMTSDLIMKDEIFSYMNNINNILTDRNIVHKI